MSKVYSTQECPALVWLPKIRFGASIKQDVSVNYHKMILIKPELGIIVLNDTILLFFIDKLILGQKML